MVVVIVIVVIVMIIKIPIIGLCGQEMLPRPWEVGFPDLGKLLPKLWGTTLGSWFPDLGTRPWEVAPQTLGHALGKYKK